MRLGAATAEEADATDHGQTEQAQSCRFRYAKSDRGRRGTTLVVAQGERQKRSVALPQNKLPDRNRAALQTAGYGVAISHGAARYLHGTEASIGRANGSALGKRCTRASAGINNVARTDLQRVGTGWGEVRIIRLP